MDPKDKLKLRGNFRYIVGQIKVGDVRDYLFEKGILNEDDFEELEPGRKTERNNVRTLLKILFRKGPKAYPEFCEALAEAEYSHVVEKLKDTDPSKINVESQDELDSFLKEEGQMVEFQRRLWHQTEMLDQYKREVDKLKVEHQELKTSKDELAQRYADMEYQIKEKGVTEEYMIQYLEGYMDKIHADEIDSGRIPGNVAWVTKPSSPMMPRSANKDRIVKIAMELSHDIVRFLISNPNSGPPPPNKYALTMRRTVVMMTEKYSKVFLEFIDKLSILEMNGFEMLEGVADELFRVGENNWGRVVALYAFGAFIAQHAEKNQMHSITTYVEDYVGRYVAKNLSTWIVQKGGWDDFEEFFHEKDSNAFGWKGLFVTAIGLGALISLASVRGSS